MSETIKLCAMVARHDQSEWSDETREMWVAQACRARDEHDAMKRDIQVLSPRGYNKENERLRAENAELTERMSQLASEANAARGQAEVLEEEVERMQETIDLCKAEAAR